MDFTISGHVNRSLVVVDTDDFKDNDKDISTAEVKNNGASSTRVRWTGSSEMMDGTSVGIQVEYQEVAGGGLGLRHANVNYAGEFGKVTIGQGSEAGDGSAYRGNVRTFGIGHGQELGSFAGAGGGSAYFGSLDAGGRVNMIRYDTPALGPVGAAVSVGNDDRVSLAATLSTEFSGSSFNAMVASLRQDSHVEGKAQETVGASFGVSMANGLGISGAWARGDNHGSKAAVKAEGGYGCFAKNAVKNDGSGTKSGKKLDIKQHQYVIPDPRMELGVPRDDLDEHCEGAKVDGVAVESTFGHSTIREAKKAETGTDPSYFQAAVAYSFGDTTVSASWYNSEDFVKENSEGTAYGVGVNHNMPKVGAQVYAAVQNFSVEEQPGASDKDATVFQIGTRVRF